jgi:hypothetical protein
MENNQNTQFNLIGEFVKLLKDNNFSDEEINFFCSLPIIIYASDKPLYEQMSAICTALYRIIYYTHPSAPISLRYYMVVNENPMTWLDGVRVNVIPYIRKKNILKRLCDEQKRSNSEQNSRTIH